MSYGVPFSFSHQTPLLIAVMNDDVDIVRSLLRAGAKTDDPIVLRTAILQSNKDIIELLLQYGADPKNGFDILQLPDQKDIEEVLKNTNPLPPLNVDKALAIQSTPQIQSLRDLFDKLPSAPVQRKDPPISLQLI